MRIILIQAEIEQAIRAYVLNQITVKDGQDITIDFKNTRGDDGATAEINISHLAPAQPVQQKPTTTYRSRSTAETKPEPEKAPEKEPEQPAQEPQEAEPEPEVGDTTEDPSETSPAPAAEATADTTAQTEQEPAQDASTSSDEGTKEEGTGEAAEPDENPAGKPGPSLFANLTKPVNKK